ncbi:hypothetical protein Tco_0997532, partial [Tanacetum coccineum]
CGALYTADFCCSKGSLEDKILVPKPPQNCATCGNSVDGLNCQPCAFVRKCLNEGWWKGGEIFLKIKQTMEKEQNQPEVMQELLLKLMDDLQILKGSQQEKKETAAQSFIPYWNFSMIDDEEARENFMKIFAPFLRKFSAIPFGVVTPKHLDTIPSVENLVPIPSELEGISDDTCDVPVGEDSSTFDALSDHSEILSDSNNDGTSSDDDSYENIEYVEASPLNLEIVSLEEVNKDQEEKEFDLEDIFQIQDVILREKLVKISRLITNIESLKDNPTPDHVFKSPSLVPISITDSDSFFEKSDTSLSHLDNSLPEFETFSDHTEETRSGSTTTHGNNSLPEYDSFLFEIELDQEGLISIVISNNSNYPLLELPEFESFHFDLYPSFTRPPPEPSDVEICLNFKPDTAVINNFDELNEDEYFDPRGGEIVLSQNVEDDDSFTFVIQTFLPFLTYPEVSPLLFSTRSEDTIFDPGIST